MLIKILLIGETSLQFSAKKLMQLLNKLNFKGIINLIWLNLWHHNSLYH